jgi:hypothetical protein
VLGGVDFRGSVDFEILPWSFSFSSELFLALLCHFAWVCRFSCRLLAFAVFFLDDLIKIFLAFWVI